MITRREALRRGLGTAAALSALPLLEACAPSGVTVGEYSPSGVSVMRAIAPLARS